MRPPEEEIGRLVAEWVKKADLDFSTSLRLSAEPEFRDIVVFHAQQAVEKYLKALLTRHQTEFPKNTSSGACCFCCSRSNQRSPMLLKTQTG